MEMSNVSIVRNLENSIVAPVIHSDVCFACMNDSRNQLGIMTIKGVFERLKGEGGFSSSQKGVCVSHQMRGFAWG